MAQVVIDKVIYMKNNVIKIKLDYIYQPENLKIKLDSVHFMIK